MSKNKTSKKKETPPPDQDADLERWRSKMLEVYLPDAGSQAERRHVNMHVNLTAHLACELRAVRRAIEGGVK